jgi:thiol-disulfide isomerase/thioredoxin
MKKLLLIAMLLPASLWAFQKNTAAKQEQVPSKPGKMVTLTCRLYGTNGSADSVYLYESIGLAKRVVARAGKSGPDSAYVLKVPTGPSRFYLVGANEQLTAKVILGQEESVTLWGNTQFMYKARTVNSAANKELEAVAARVSQFAEESTYARARYNGATGNMRRSIEDELKALQRRKSSFLDSLKAANPLLWRMASLQVTPDYFGQGGSEADFYAKEYFRWADFSDKSFDQIPDVFNAFENYTAVLTQYGMTGEKVLKLMEETLARVSPQSATYRMALGGIVSSLKATNNAQYPIVARKYLELYRDKNLGEIPVLDYEMKKAATFLTGFEAPDLEGMTPDSSRFALKQLRGKVVLVDFWASWCGPCRRENPNVVANYKKYHPKGFDILGVSLDREINAWRNAIKQDGLLWHHISDLKGWQSAHAAMYSVTSIPQTILLDREGKIIARNLRGEQLEQKLKEIFGE